MPGNWRSSRPMEMNAGGERGELSAIRREQSSTHIQRSSPISNSVLIPLCRTQDPAIHSSLAQRQRARCVHADEAFSGLRGCVESESLGCPHDHDTLQRNYRGACPHTSMLPVSNARSIRHPAISSYILKVDANNERTVPRARRNEVQGPYMRMRSTTSHAAWNARGIHTDGARELQLTADPLHRSTTHWHFCAASSAGRTYLELLARARSPLANTPRGSV
ncbi:hypothetical protein C8Q74DRAFT_868728 [Fomes fomentarius]|nr:hypothetical protein C8Q74DRAFT_868728 [Fomes fomentarius]